MTEQFDLWCCDVCHNLYPRKATQHTVRIQQTSERVYGTDQMYRPVETSVVCDACFRVVYGSAMGTKR